MKPSIILAVIAVLMAMLCSSARADVENYGNAIRYYGSGTNDNDVLFTTGDMTAYSACTLMSTTGAVDVQVSLDGTYYSTAPLSIQDFGATSNDRVLVTAALRTYGFAGKFKTIRVLQNGATGAAASLLCWKYGQG
ncbi:MAG: hypothetical protein AB7F22_17675 [Reyranella sp.]|uniref:hypothetical protein n=1 Tax=Reyranella sp. TaxID=1929291 RepID=UPI003D12BD0A